MGLLFVLEKKFIHSLSLWIRLFYFRSMAMMKTFPDKILKQLFKLFYKPILEKYLSAERNYRYQSLHLKIFPGVFHPRFFFSTKILLGYLERYELQNQSFLELGAGSGLIAISAAKKGAAVTATDISRRAMENISVNKQLNNVILEEIHSDLFDSIPQQIFDFIVINPPYYKGIIRTEADHAWYAGEHLDYFQKLFRQLPAYMKARTHSFMILSDECDIDGIQSLAAANQLTIRQVFSKKVFWETNFIYEIHF